MLNPMESLPHFNGILFIGDPHVKSKRPGRRKDDYLSSVLEKLETCAQISNEFSLLTIITGDLMDRHDDSKIEMLNRLIAVLKQFETTVISVEGNHCKGEDSLGITDTVYLLHQTNTIRAITKAGPFMDVVLNGQPVRLFATPYGAPIPTQVDAPEGFKTLMVTHHDLAFDSTYPNALPLFEIKGLDHVVNGHQHGTKPSKQKGQTTWHLPGNIEPLSIDLIHHVPCAWIWDGESKELNPIELPHGEDIFDLTGIQVQAADAQVAVSQMIESQFAHVIAQDKMLCQEAERTEDASVLAKDLDDVFAAGQISEPSQQLLSTLFESVQQQLQAT